MPDSSTKDFKVEQYCYFWIRSETVSAGEIALAIGLEPDRIVERGSRSLDPFVVPVEHGWYIDCRRHGRIDDQISDVLRRIEPSAEAIRALVQNGEVGAGLMMVRYFDDEDGDCDALGWHLSPEQVALIGLMRAEIQADEYH